MAFNIRMGVPGMEAMWSDLVDRARRSGLDKDEQTFYRKLVKAFGYLRENPRHNSLASHEIGDITILGVEAHPEDKKHGAYQRIKLASMPGKKA